MILCQYCEEREAQVYCEALEWKDIYLSTGEFCHVCFLAHRRILEYHWNPVGYERYLELKLKEAL